MPVINDARPDHDGRYEQVWRLKKHIEREMGPSDRPSSPKIHNAPATPGALTRWKSRGANSSTDG